MLSDAENVEQKDQLSVAMRSFEVEKMRLVRDAVEIGAKMCNPALGKNIFKQHKIRKIGSKL